MMEPQSGSISRAAHSGYVMKRLILVTRYNLIWLKMAITVMSMLRPASPAHVENKSKRIVSMRHCHLIYQNTPHRRFNHRFQPGAGFIGVLVSTHKCHNTRLWQK